MCYRENKYLFFFFDVIKNDQIFLSNICHFQYDHRFLFSREMGNIRTCKEYVCKNVLKLDCQDSIELGIF